MLERKAIKMRLYPTLSQEHLFRRTVGLCRLVYNIGLEQRRCFARRGRSIGYAQQAGELADLKAEFPFVGEAPHHCLQQALVNLEGAYKRFWSGEAGPPRYKRRGNGDSFRFPDARQFEITEGGIKLPKAKVVSGVMARPLPDGAVLKSVTVSREGAWWVASVQYEREVEVPSDRSAEPMVGIDLGVAQAIVTSNGVMLETPHLSKSRRRRKRRLHQRIARARKGSNNRRRAVARLAAHEAHSVRVRRDAIEKITTRLAKSHGCIAMEDLRVRNMTASASGTIEEPGRNVRQKAGLNRSILEGSFGLIRLRLGQKLAALGGILLVVPAAHSSQRCSSCGHIAAGNRASRDWFSCMSCGYAACADANAAENIRQRALGLWGDSSSIKVAASLKMLLAQQARPKRRFKKNIAEGISASVCGDLCALGQSTSTKQKMGRREPARLAALAAS